MVNLESSYGARLAIELRKRDLSLLTFSPSGAEGSSTPRAADVSFDATGSRFRCLAPGGEVGVRMPLPGHFNVENALAAIGACHALGVAAEAAATALASAGRVPRSLRASGNWAAVRRAGRLRPHAGFAREVLGSARSICEGD